MKLLLDTHSFMWFVAGDTRLSKTAREAIEDAANEKFVSVASAWEIAIKHSLGKIVLSEPYEIFMSGQIAVNGFELLNITVEHTAIVANLELHHRDPFDRLLIAQAMVEGMTIVSKDDAFKAYPVICAW
ncbi:MAG: type II toxin-antitoxin system VapC family toxin [Pyrinomonadaceae bacterium MAG19_C2-C3]|nr:type II toxin-antitoxin system VapC family toxin [Pyrinomonadaceae bacterium MAG19_C2-C3]